MRARAGRSLGVVTNDTLTGLDQNTRYCIAVQAWSVGGGSLSYAWTNATTAPTAPTGLSVRSLGSNGFTLAWSNPSGSLTGNQVGVGSACSSLTGVGGAMVRTAQVVGSLSASTTYCVEVIATGEGGSSVGLWGNVTTLPAAPTGLGFSSINATGVTVTWTN